MTGAEEQAIVDQIESFIKIGAMFTAFDVTKVLRNSGKTVVHGQAKGIVHKFDFPTSYTRTIISVPGVPVNPFLYHPKGIDISTYKQGNIVSTPVSATVNKVPSVLSSDAAKDLSAIPKSPITQAERAGLFKSTLTRLGFNKNPITNLIQTPKMPTFKSNSGFLVNLDARGRYIMRTSVVNAAGLFPGDMVFMYIDRATNEILLIKSNCPDLPDTRRVTAMTVDKDKNLLIFKKYIIEAFGAIPMKFEFTTDKNQIRIRGGN